METRASLTSNITKSNPFDVLSMAGIGRRKPGPDKKYATFNRRMLAATVDSLVLIVLAPWFNQWVPIDQSAFERHMPANPNDRQAARQMLLGVLTDPHFLASWFINGFAQMLIFCLLSGVCWHFWSATPGK